METAQNSMSLNAEYCPKLTKELIFQNIKIFPHKCLFNLVAIPVLLIRRK